MLLPPGSLLGAYWPISAAHGNLVGVAMTELVWVSEKQVSATVTQLGVEHTDRLVPVLLQAGPPPTPPRTQFSASWVMKKLSCGSESSTVPLKRPRQAARL